MLHPAEPQTSSELHIEVTQVWELQRCVCVRSLSSHKRPQSELQGLYVLFVLQENKLCMCVCVALPPCLLQSIIKLAAEVVSSCFSSQSLQQLRPEDQPCMTQQGSPSSSGLLHRPTNRHANVTLAAAVWSNRSRLFVASPLSVPVDPDWAVLFHHSFTIWTHCSSEQEVYFDIFPKINVV